jgi:hypothetical protein
MYSITFCHSFPSPICNLACNPWLSILLSISRNSIFLPVIKLFYNAYTNLERIEPPLWPFLDLIGGSVSSRQQAGNSSVCAMNAF